MATTTFPSPLRPAAKDINILSTFLANSQLPSLIPSAPTSQPQITTLILCASSVLTPATHLFQTLTHHPTLTRTLILCGGIGHSTPLIYAAVANHPIYHIISREIEGLPEAQVLFMILARFFDLARITAAGCRILVEDQSTNCGANAVECRKVLEREGLEVGGRVVLMQDATMSLRTRAALEKVFSSSSSDQAMLEIFSYPGITPLVRTAEWEGEYGVEFDEVAMGMVVRKEELWGMKRFLDLIMGEVPRLELYGPRGMGSIVDVVMGEEVRGAWERLSGVLRGRD